MAFVIEEITNDLLTMDYRGFFEKYFMSKQNWYFETVLGARGNDLIPQIRDFSNVVSNAFNTSEDDVVVVGSCRLGYSLNPHKTPVLQEFNMETSDIDVAVISSTHFLNFWNLLRASYHHNYKHFYDISIPKAIYRGYINHVHVSTIQGCREQWRSLIPTKELLRKWEIKSRINYRIYRTMDDLVEYQIEAIKKARRALKGG